MDSQRLGMMTEIDPVRIDRFVQLLIQQVPPRIAARRAGFSHLGDHARKVDQLMAHPDVVAQLEDYQASLRERFHFDRERSVKMLMRAYEIGELQADPRSMVVSVSELNKMHGYHAPQKVEAEVTFADATTRRALAELSDEELVEGAGIVIDGEFQEVSEGDPDAVGE